MQSLSLAAIVLFIAKELWDLFKTKDKALKDNTLAVLENSFRIKELTKRMDDLYGLPQDVNEAHNKIRIIEERLKVYSQLTDIDS